MNLYQDDEKNHAVWLVERETDDLSETSSIRCIGHFTIVDEAIPMTVNHRIFVLVHGSYRVGNTPWA